MQPSALRALVALSVTLACGAPPAPDAAKSPAPAPAKEAPPAKPPTPPEPAAPPPPRVTLAAGDQHACALVRTGGEDRVKCWGGNEDGQLGLGDVADRGLKKQQMGDGLAFVDLGPGAPVVSIAAAGRRTCALRGDGKLQCWGDGWGGALGRGDDVGRGGKPGEMGAALSAIDLPGPALALVMGHAHTCVLLAAGEVACFGANHDGALGLGDREPRGDGPGELGAALPRVALGAGLRARALAAGPSHTCALVVGAADGVKCWGAGGHGQLGLADSGDHGVGAGQMGDALPRVDLGGGFVAAEVSLGGLHTCARATDGRVKCWGSNASGQLGVWDRRGPGRKPGQDPTPPAMGDGLPAVDLGAGVKATAIAAGNSRTCAIVAKDGAPGVKCWGAGALGLGDEEMRGDQADEMGDALPFVELGKDLVPVALALGTSHTCALLVERADPTAATGRVKCWGGNERGSLGLGDDVARGFERGQMGDALPFVDLGKDARVVVPR